MMWTCAHGIGFQVHRARRQRREARDVQLREHVAVPRFVLPVHLGRRRVLRRAALPQADLLEP